MELIENETYLYLEDDRYTIVIYTGPMEIPEELRIIGDDYASVHIFEFPDSNGNFLLPMLAAIVLDEDLPKVILPLSPLEQWMLYGR